MIEDKNHLPDLSQGFNRKNFVKLNETAHGILPWQREINDILGNDEHTLSPEANEEFEAEANYFASITLFQHDRFISELNKLNLSIDSAMYLAKHFGASIHASLRRYIDCSKNRCALAYPREGDKLFQDTTFVISNGSPAQATIQ